MKTTIEVSKELRTKLINLKYKLDAGSMDEVIKKMYDLIVKFKMKEEMK